MPVLVKMPKWGLTMKAGKVTQWLRAEGNEVTEGEPLLEVESEKATNDVEAPASGVLRKIIAGEGDEVPVSDPVAIIAADGEVLTDEDVSSFLLALEAEKEHAAEQAAARRQERQARPAARMQGGRVNASPAARKLAQELGVDLTTVEATGPGGRITSDDVQRAAAEASGVREDYVTLSDGRRLFSVLAGSGTPTLVFLHGLSGSQSTWAMVLEELAQRYRVCAFDLPGHGRSDKPAPSQTDYSLRGMSDAVAEALNTLKLTPAVLVGHSLGGAVAIQVALDHPDAVSGLVLVDSAGLGREINPELLDRIEAEPDRDEVRRLLELFFHNPKYVLQSGVDEAYAYRAEPGGQEALQAVAAANFSRQGQHTGLPERLNELAVRTLVVWGAQDRIIPVAHADTAGQAIAGATVEVLDNVGHVPQIEAADEFVRLVEAFLGSES